MRVEPSANDETHTYSNITSSNRRIAPRSQIRSDDSFVDDAYHDGEKGGKCP